MQKQSSTYRRKSFGFGRKELKAFPSTCSIVKFAIVTEMAAPIAVPVCCLKICPLCEKYVLAKQNSSRRHISSAVSGVLSFRVASFSRAVRAADTASGTGTLVNNDTTSNETRLSSSSMHTCDASCTKCLELRT